MCPFPAGEVLPRKQGASHCCGARRKQNGQAPNAKHQTHPPVHTIQLPTFIGSTGVREGLNTLAALQLQGIAEQSSWRRSIGKAVAPCWPPDGTLLIAESGAFFPHFCLGAQKQCCPEKRSWLALSLQRADTGKSRAAIG